MSFTEDRLKAQTRMGVNIVVEAGAGTGKTTLLIDRLCLAVLAQNTPVEKLVALTFTEKAAAEIKTRFVAKLQNLVAAVKKEIDREQQETEEPQKTDGAQQEKQDSTLALLREYFPEVQREDLVQRAEAALSRLDRASIGTIHGFCADILKSFPLEAGLSPNAQIDAGQKAAQLFNARWNAFLDSELGLNAPRAAQWKQVLGEISLPDLKDFAAELCSGKIESYDYYAHQNLLAASCLEKSSRAKEMAESFSAEIKKPRKVEKMLVWAAESLKRTAAFLKGETFSDPAGEYVKLNSGDQAKGWDDESFEEACSLIDFAGKTTPEKQYVFLSAYNLVKDITAFIRQDYAREGLLSFDDLIVKTRNLLLQNPSVREQLKAKFDVLFIDEFQDTDPVQGELLLFLAEAKNRHASRWQDVRLEPGKLYVVGDPKQSIYRFRGADITAYELFTDLILRQGGEKCFLQENFRSTPEIVETANSVCSRAMIQQTAFQPAYVPIYTSKTLRNGAVQWIFVPAPKEGGKSPSADDFRDNQAERMADWISQNVGVLTLADGHKLQLKDIALLTRAATTATPYTEALRRRGIAFNVETDKKFYRKQEVSDFLNFLRAVSDPEDKISLAGTLRSPLFGFTDEELYQVAKRGELSLYARPTEEKLARAFAVLNKFSRLAGRRGLKDFLTDILEDTFLPEACAAAYEGERTLGNLKRLAGLADGYAADGPASLSQFLADVQTLLEEHPDRLAASTADDALDAVSVLTVHKSKGLQFPVVILADMTKKDSSSSADPVKHIFSWQYNMHGLRVGKICDVNLAFLEEEQKKHGKCEEVRVLYVALTRAREKMLLIADARKDAAKAAAPFVSAGLFPDGETLPKTLTDGELTVPVCYEAYELPENFRYRHNESAASQGTERDVARWRASYDARKARYQKWISEDQLRAPSELADPNLLTEEQRAGAELGTVCHRALELMLSQKQVPEQAVALACVKCAAPHRANEAREVLLPFAQSSLFAELSACRVLGCEMPFSYLEENGEVESGVMDAVLITADNRVWIVDYKTDKVKPGQEPQLLEKKYRLQLDIYRRAAEKIFPGRTVRCSAVFVRTFAAADL